LRSACPDIIRPVVRLRREFYAHNCRRRRIDNISATRRDVKSTTAPLLLLLLLVVVVVVVLVVVTVMMVGDSRRPARTRV